MSKRIQGFLGDLPTLVAEGVVPADVADRIRDYYAKHSPGGGSRNWALAISSMLGALLIGGGIILLLAHNWSDLDRNARTLISLAPMFLGQLYGGWLLARGENGPGRREGAATFLVLAIGATIALIAQTYHLSDDFGTFLLTWMLVSAPLMYLFDSSLAAMLYLAGMTGWVLNEHYALGHQVRFWLFAAIAAPLLWKKARHNKYNAGTAWLFWTAAICVCIALGATMDDYSHDGSILLGYCSLFSVYYLVGRLWFGDAPTLWQRPLHAIGAAGIAVLSLVLTYQDTLRHSWVDNTPMEYILMASVAALLAYSAQRKQYGNLILGVMPFVALIGMATQANFILLNLYVFAAALAILASGYRENRALKFNGGLLLLSALIACRFFDSDIGLLARGIVFIGLGIAFIIANRFMSRRKQEAP